MFKTSFEIYTGRKHNGFGAGKDHAVFKCKKSLFEKLPASGEFGVTYVVENGVHTFTAKHRNLLENYLCNQLGMLRATAFEIITE